MQFYLAIEFLLGTHSQKDVEKIGKEKFNHEFDAVTCQAVKQVYLVRHMYFGHAHPNRASNGDPDHTFSIVKQILVARWAARRMIELSLGMELVHREMRFYSGNGSLEFRGTAEELNNGFAVPE